MEASQTKAAVLEKSALGAYWKRLRHAAHLTQEQLLAKLRACGLNPSVKQIWAWEKGENTPSSPSLTIMNIVLGGDAEVACELLKYDLRLKAHIAKLKQILAECEPTVRIVQSIGQPMDNVQAEKVARYEAANQELNQIAEEAVQRGIKEAEAQIKKREHKEIMQNAVDTVPPEFQREAWAILVQLSLMGEEKAQQFLEFGRFLVSSD